MLNYNASYWGWLNSRKAIFLVGTEAPDNSGVGMILNGDAITGFGDTTWHHIYFNEDGTISNNEDDSALRAKTMGDLANACIEDGDLDKAAFYLGVMTHYIADMSMFCHVSENNVPPHDIYFDQNHSKIESYVQTRTNDVDDMEDFFKISSFVVGSKKPYDAAIDLAWDTYNDSTNDYEHNAVWMFYNFFAPWVQSYEQRAGASSVEKEYYNRIETCLNNAIKACIDTINYEAGSGIYDDDDDDDEEEEEDEKQNNLLILPMILISAAIAIIAIISLIIYTKWKK